MNMLLPAPLFKRKADSHKSDFGHVFILAGSLRYAGAACLCAGAAMRAGAGLVTLGHPKSLHSVFASKLTEVMTLPLPETKDRSLSEAAFREIKLFLERADCLLIGPGLSHDAVTQRLVRSVVACAPMPMVVDADGLNALVSHLTILRKAKSSLILTPHPGEMARLLNTNVAAVQKDRIKVAKEFSLRYNITLALKGHRTVVAAPGKKIYVNQTGNPGMATAGSGDVLSGIMAAFLGQGLTPFNAARYAVYVHGLAADLAAGDKTEISLIASDIIEYLPLAFKKAICRSSSVGRAAVL